MLFNLLMGMKIRVGTIGLMAKLGTVSITIVVAEINNNKVMAFCF